MWIISCGIWCLVYIVLFICTTARVAGNHYLHESQLHKDLMTEYKRDVRPAMESEQPVLVKVYPTVVRVNRLDEENAMLETTISLSMSWSDPRLKWYPVDHGGITQTHVTLDKLWTPDIGPSNGKSVHETFTMAAVSSSGTVAAVMIHKTSSYCDLDLSRFPRDSQTCDIMIGSWIYSYSQLSMEFWDGDKISMNVQIPDNAKTDTRTWSVEEPAATAEIYNVTHECCPEDPFMQLKISLQLVRQSGYLSQVLMCQIVVFLILVPVQFLLPHSSRKRTLFGMLVLIGGLLLMHSLLQFIPHISSSSVRLGQIYLANFSLGLVALVLSTLITWVSRQQVRGRSMPALVRALLPCLRRTCHYDNESKPKAEALLCKEEPSGGSHVELNTFRSIHRHGHNGTSESSDQTDSEDLVPTDHVDSAVATTALVSTLKQTNILISELRRRFVDKDIRKCDSSEWSDLATLLDRVCFFLVCVLSIVMLVLVLTI